MEYDKWTSCGLGIQEEEEWLLFAFLNTKGKLSVGGCSLSQQYREKDGFRDSPWSPLYSLQKMYQHPIDKPKAVVYYKNGKKEYQITYSQDSLYSTYKKWYPNGQLYYDQQSKSKKLHGKVKKYYPTGQLENQQTYEDGHNIGIEQTFYDTTDTPAGISLTKWTKAKLLDKYKELSDIGFLEFAAIDTTPKPYDFIDSLIQIYSSIQLKKEIVYNAKGEEITERHFYRNGSIKQEGFYFPSGDGRIEIQYYPNGNKKYIQQFNFGDRYSNELYFFEDGTPDHGKNERFNKKNRDKKKN